MNAKMDSIASTIKRKKQHSYTDTDSDGEFTMLRCRPLAMPISLPAMESRLTLRLHSRPESYYGSRRSQYTTHRLDTNPGENSTANDS